MITIRKRSTVSVSHVENKALDSRSIDDILNVTDVSKGCMYWCRRCKSNLYTTYTLKQTRSADEGMTVFVRCDKCKTITRK